VTSRNGCGSIDRSVAAYGVEVPTPEEQESPSATYDGAAASAGGVTTSRWARTQVVNAATWRGGGAWSLPSGDV
jgi:hypothetical protein